MLMKTFGVKLDGNHTDITIGNFSNKLLINITQTGKFGSVLRVDREIFQPFENQENIYNIRTILGNDTNENHLLVRILAESINTTKPIIFVVNLKTHSPRTVKALVKVLENSLVDDVTCTNTFCSCSYHSILSIVSNRKPMTIFGQLIIGPPGSGKSTYCCEMKKILEETGRKVAIVNLDPGNDTLPYSAVIDINEYITTSDVMNYSHLGPNGATLFCMEFLEKCTDNILEEIKKQSDFYFLIDCPGQVELYTCHDSFRNIVKSFEKIDLRLCCVHLVDSHHCSDAGKFISSLLLSLSTMLNLALPHVNVLSKIDLMEKFGDKLLFRPNYYTEVLNLSYIIDSLDQDAFTSKYQKLNRVLASFIEDYSLVHFIPANVKDKKYLLTILNAVDKANGYIFKSDEERNIQKLLSSAMSNPTYDWDCEFSENPCA